MHNHSARNISDRIAEQNRPEQIRTDKINLISDLLVNKQSFGVKSDAEIIYRAVENLPFAVDKRYVPTIIKHIQRIGLKRFNEFVEVARGARQPENYLMKCLVNFKGGQA